MATETLADVAALAAAIDRLTRAPPRVAWPWDEVGARRRAAPDDLVVGWLLWPRAGIPGWRSWSIALRLTVVGPDRPFATLTESLVAAHQRLTTARLAEALGARIRCQPAFRGIECGLLRGSLTMHIRVSAE